MTERAAPPELHRSVLPGSLGWLGLGAGLLAASTMIEDCSMSAAQAQRLKISLPVIFAVVFALLGAVLFRFLWSRRPFARTVGATIVASLLVSGLASLAYGHASAILIAEWLLGIVHAGLLIAILVITAQARRPEAAGTSDARVVAAAAAFGGVIDAVYWLFYSEALVEPLAAATWGMTIASASIALLLLAVEHRRVRALEASRGRGAAPYRELPEPTAQLAAHRSARRFIAWMLTLAVAGSVAALVAWQRPRPEPPKQRSLGVSPWNGC